MAKGGTGAGLTAEEKSLVKAMLDDGERSQDIHVLINHGRHPTVNHGRLGSAKAQTVTAATPDEVAKYKQMKRSFDPVTGLNPYTDEKLIRSREAMILAVSIFNNASYRFKTEVFSMLANVAWCYLMHDHYEKKGVSPTNADGTTWALSHMLEKGDCPLSLGIKSNLKAIKAIRDEVEHRLFGRSDGNWLAIFQACCLNFDKTIVEWHGERVSLQNDLSVALQFGKMTIDQASQIHAYDIPPNIAALDASLIAGKSDAELDDIEYQFKVVYTLDSASKSKSHIQFVSPDSQEGKDIHNVLQKYRVADEMYPHKPSDVVKEVVKANKIFTMNDHTKAWKKYKARPNNGAKKPDRTDKSYCIYHVAHKDYTYNQDWVEKLIAEAPEKPKMPIHPYFEAALVSADNVDQDMNVDVQLAPE
ncbi:DUF3644 domain-containing protein [Agrobacterium burrii]|uniref:DUF3644 domain-containing protein n=1 Tax=Agrobacterium burrii TaxID=2815339 RepID=A0ABS3EB29_9HYPH|nr:DUF3644 domain-containing protein [Agrobacterium burrii]MBO0129158.1 DUF3644 domain-containing protein [Agrobacterium burrii]